MRNIVRAGAVLCAALWAGTAGAAVGATGATGGGGARPVVLVVGATGKTGGAAVEQLVAQDRWQVRAMVRDPAKAAAFPPGVEVVTADLRDPASLTRAVQGASYVISAAGSTGGDFFGDNRPEKVDYEGTRDLAAAAQAAGVRHVCLVSSMGVTHPDHPLNKRLNNIFDWKLKGEAALRASGVGYTIVRPGGLRDEPGGRQGVKAMQGDALQDQGTIPRADVAAACVAALTLESARGVTFELVGAADRPPPDWAKLYAGLAKDTHGE
jgi:uncharacterized protein YbjT (DUF2867 family)